MQYSQRGSKSVLSQGEDRRPFVFPSLPPAKLPYDLQLRTSGPAVPHRDITHVISQVRFPQFTESGGETTQRTTPSTVLIFGLPI